MYQKWPSKPSICPGSLQDTFIIYSSILHQHISNIILQKKKISIIENLKIQKPRFTNRCQPQRKPNLWGDSPMQGWESEWGWGGGGGGGRKNYEFQSQIFGFSDFQIFNFRCLFGWEICSKKDVGEISRNK